MMTSEFWQKVAGALRQVARHLARPSRSEAARREADSAHAHRIAGAAVVGMLTG
jgi:hypothetical protein